MTSVRVTLLASLALTGLAAGAHAATFDLSGSVNATPPFSITAGGQTATFTSVPGNGFQVQSTSGLLSFSTALLDNNFFGTDALTITFSSPVVNEVLIPFAILDAYGTGDALTVTTGSGAVRTFAAVNDGLPLGEPEGLVGFVPSTPTTVLTLTSTQAFAIGNVTVPEPMSLSLLGVGLAGVAVLRRRKRVG